MVIVVTAVLDFSSARSCEPTTFIRVVIPLFAGGTGKDENLFWCARCTELVSVPGQGYYFLDIHVPSCRTAWLTQSHFKSTQSRLHFVIDLPVLCVVPVVWDNCYDLHNVSGVGYATFLGWDHFAKYLTIFSCTSLLLLRSSFYRNHVEFPSGSHGFPVLLQWYEHRVLHFRCRSVSFFIDDFNFIPLYSMVLIIWVLLYFGPGCFSVFVLHLPCATYVAYLCLPSLALSSWYYEMEVSGFIY